MCSSTDLSSIYLSFVSNHKQKATAVLFDCSSMFLNSSVCFKDKILWIECPYENNEFKSEIIRYMSNFPQYEIKFIEHGYQFD